MKFIHTADLHLDSPFDNLRNDGTPNELWQLVYKSTYQSFAKIIQAAIDNNVDFVLIAGDLFDRQDQNVRAQNFLKHQLEILNQHQIPALISFGNHDYYSGDYQALDYPSNTYVFPPKVETKQLRLSDGTVVNVTGFSYANRWNPQRVIDQFPVKHNCDYQIGMIHGQISSGQSNYAPFSLQELLSKHYDYWALGHVHKRQIVNNHPPVVYPGNIQGRNPNEKGDKGYLLVDTDQDFKPVFNPTSTINWLTLPIEVKSADHEADLVNLILRSLEQRHFNKMQLVQIKLCVKSHATLSSDLVKMIYNQNLLDQVQAGLKDRYLNVNAWIYRIELEVTGQSKTTLDSELWSKSADQIFKIDNVDHLAKKLFRYPFINQHFNNSAGIKRLKSQIVQLITNHRGSQDDN